MKKLFLNFKPGHFSGWMLNNNTISGQAECADKRKRIKHDFKINDKLSGKKDSIFAAQKKI